MPDYEPPPGYEEPGERVGEATGLFANIVRLPVSEGRYVRPGTVSLSFTVNEREVRVMDDGAGTWLRPFAWADGEWKYVTPLPEYPTQQAAERGTCDYRTGTCRVALEVAPTKGTPIHAVYRTDDDGPTIDLSGAADDDTPRALDVSQPDRPGTTEGGPDFPHGEYP